MKRLVREADQWEGGWGTGRFPSIRRPGLGVGRSLPGALRARRRREVRDGDPPTSLPLEQPGTALLARHLAVEKPLDDLPVRAKQGVRGKPAEQPQRVPPRCVRRESLTTVDAETAGLGEGLNRLDAARVRARDDSFERIAGERLGQRACVRAAGSAQRARAIERRRRAPLACASMSEQQHPIPPEPEAGLSNSGTLRSSRPGPHQGPARFEAVQCRAHT